MADEPREGWTAKHAAAAHAAGKASWTAWCEEIEAAKGFKICGRMAGVKGPKPHPCSKAAGGETKHNERWGPCKYHGGDSLAGPEHGAYKDGHRMDRKYRVRGNLAHVYERLDQQVQDAFDLEAEARVLDARMVTLVESLPEDPATPRTLRKAVSETRRLVQLAIKGKLTKEQQHVLAGSLQNLDERCGSALVETHVWEDWRRLVEQKRKLADTKARQDQRAHGPVLWQDVVMVTENIRQIVLDCVPPEQQSVVLKRFRAMLERPGYITETTSAEV